jgi:hypothetical protein
VQLLHFFCGRCQAGDLFPAGVWAPHQPHRPQNLLASLSACSVIRMGFVEQKKPLNKRLSMVLAPLSYQHLISVP